MPPEISRLPNIVAIDYVDGPRKLAEIYSAADVFVNPTVGDNFPTVNLEALACGTPVVTFDTGGSGESVGECGVVVKAGDIYALKDAIYNCIKQEIDSRKCVLHAQKFDKSKRYDEYIELFSRAQKRT